MSLNILIVIPYYIPAWSLGGPLRIAHIQAKEFIKMGAKVTVLTTDVGDTCKRLELNDEVIDGVKIVRIPNFSIYLAKKFNLFFGFGILHRLYTNLFSYDIIHIHDVFNGHALSAMIVAKFSKIPYVFHTHGLWCKDRIDAKFTLIKTILLRVFIPLFEGAKAVYAGTDYEILDIQQLSNDISYIKIPNSLDYSYFENIEAFNLRTKYGVFNDTIIFTYVGRIQFIKGLDIAFKALSKIGHRNWKYIIIGPDEGEKNNLVQLARELDITENIVWVGQIGDDTRFSYIKGGDIFLFTSRSEGFPMGALEALACRSSLVLSHGTHLKELDVYDGVSFVDQNNIEEIVEVLQAKYSLYVEKKLVVPDGTSKKIYDNQFVAKKIYDNYILITNKSYD